MPETTDAGFDYVRDDARRRIHIIAHRALQGDDLLAIIDRQAADRTWTYGIVYDLRGAEGATSRIDSVSAGEVVQAYTRAYGRRGPVAIVTRSADMVASAQSYAYEAAKAGSRIDVFSDIEEADEWLDRQIGAEDKER